MKLFLPCKTKLDDGCTSKRRNSYSLVLPSFKGEKGKGCQLLQKRNLTDKHRLMYYEETRISILVICMKENVKMHLVDGNLFS